jgi:hypothetical protein
MLENMFSAICKRGRAKVIRQGVIIRIPYKVRSVSSLRATVRRAVFTVACGDEVHKVFVFEKSAGLVPAFFACSGDRVEVAVSGLQEVYDSLANLKHEVPAIKLVIGGCEIRLRWSSSRYVIDEHMLRECKACVKLK